MMTKNSGPRPLLFLTEHYYCIYCQQHVKLFQHNESFVKYWAWDSLSFMSQDFLLKNSSPLE